jgi:cytochrome b561
MGFVRPILSPAFGGWKIIGMLRNSRECWGSVSRSLHWLVAGLIFVQLALGLAAIGWHLSPTKLDLFVWHKSVGMLILLLVLARLAWRLANPTPAPPPDTPSWERLAAHASHALLYALMLVLPLSGWIINSASNVPVRLFWLVPLPHITAPDKGLADTAKVAHLGLVLALAVLLFVHVGAALRHHYLKGDDALRRMLLFTRRAG